MAEPLAALPGTVTGIDARLLCIGFDLLEADAGDRITLLDEADRLLDWRLKLTHERVAT